MKPFNLKESVKRGQMTPGAAFEKMLAHLGTVEQREAAAESRTGRWLRSKGAAKRYKAARKGKR
jgi:hypothetical protein